MSHPFFVIPHQFLVQPLPQSPATLVGSPIVDDYLPITVDYSRPFIFFPRNQPVQCFFGQPMLAVHILPGVAPPAAAAPILLPPLLATHLMRPVNPALYLVPVSSLWVTIPAPRRNYVPPVLGPQPGRVLGPPGWVLGPQQGPVLGPQQGPVRGPQQSLILAQQGWVVGPPVRVIGRPTRRTVYIKFVAGVAPITGAELDSFFRERVNHQEHIVEIRSSPEDGEAFVTFSRPAAVERMFNDDLGREIQFQIDGKFFWAYPQLFWNDTGSDRRAFLSFELGEAPSVEEVYSHFNTGNPETQRVVSVKFENREMPSHGHLYFYTSAAVQHLLKGKSDITLEIGGKNIIVMKYVPQSQRNKAKQDVPH